MIGFGKLLVLLGAGSFALHFMNMEFKLLMWVDLWGAATGNAIRIGMIVVGAALCFLGLKAVGKTTEGDAFSDISEKA